MMMSGQNDCEYAAAAGIVLDGNFTMMRADNFISD